MYRARDPRRRVEFEIEHESEIDMEIVSGILISADVFSENWFWYLGAFVAFNTLVFVGLTFGKVVPWPSPASETTLEEWRDRLSRFEHVALEHGPLEQDQPSEHRPSEHNS